MGPTEALASDESNLGVIKWNMMGTHTSHGQVSERIDPRNLQQRELCEKCENVKKPGNIHGHLRYVEQLQQTKWNMVNSGQEYVFLSNGDLRVRRNHINKKRMVLAKLVEEEHMYIRISTETAYCRLQRRMWWLGGK